VEPAVTKTVSYFKVSAEIVTLASPEVINESFLQEKSTSRRDIISIPGSFILSKVKLSVEREKCKAGF